MKEESHHRWTVPAFLRRMDITHLLTKEQQAGGKAPTDGPSVAGIQISSDKNQKF